MTEEILDSVRLKYGAAAESALSSNHAGVKAVADILSKFDVNAAAASVKVYAVKPGAGA